MIIFDILLINGVLTVREEFQNNIKSLITSSFQRNHVKITPMMTMLAVSAVSSIPLVLTMNLTTISYGLFHFILTGYAFVVLLSLHDMFRNEKKHDNIIHMQTVVYV